MINFAYFKRFFKESSIFLIATAIIFSLINFVAVFESPLIATTNHEYFTSFIYPLYILLFIGPLYVLNYKDSKKKVDVFYSLPISRTAFLSTRILVFLLDSFIIYFVSYFIAVITSCMDETALLILNYGNVILFFLTTFLAFIPLFFFTTYFANKGNSIIDKIVFMAFYSFGFIALFYCLVIGFRNIYNYNITRVQFYGQGYFLVISPFLYLTTVFHCLINKNFTPEEIAINTLDANQSLLPGAIIFIVLGLVLLFLLLKEEKRDKVERVSQVSTTIFGYKIIIPYVPYIVFGCFNYSDSFWSTLYLMLAIISLALFIITYFVYKRKLVIQKDAIIYSALFLVNLVVVSVCSL